MHAANSKFRSRICMDKSGNRKAPRCPGRKSGRAASWWRLDRSWEGPSTQSGFVRDKKRKSWKVSQMEKKRTAKLFQIQLGLPALVGLFNTQKLWGFPDKYMPTVMYEVLLRTVNPVKLKNKPGFICETMIFNCAFLVLTGVGKTSRHFMWCRCRWGLQLHTKDRIS